MKKATDIVGIILAGGSLVLGLLSQILGNKKTERDINKAVDERVDARINQLLSPLKKDNE